MTRTRWVGWAVLLSCSGIVQAADEGIAMVDHLKTEPANTFYVGNRTPLLPSPLIKLPIGAIAPRGWLRTQLLLEADGFTGRLTEISAFLDKKNNAWLNPAGAGQHGWEEVPYWLKGFGDLGYVLGDERIIREARIWIDGALGSQRPDGYFGPQANLTHPDAKGKPDLWPNMIMLNAIQSYYEFSSDPRVLDFMAKYFRWELQLPEQDFLLPFWQQQRAADNLASVYWLYNRTGENWLLELAEKIQRRTANWTDSVVNWHGVNIAQAFRGPAVYYQQAKDRKFLDATQRDYDEVLAKYGQVPGGGYGSDENCRPGYSGPRQGTETCTWAELMLSFEQLLTIAGGSKWADRCEEIAFNSLPASMTADLKALHYLTSPNLIACDRKNHAPGFENDGDMLSFNPRGFRCCQHNVAHAWPYFAEHLWLATPGNGLAAVLYAPCQVKAKVGDGTEVTITEETKYPFEDTINFKLDPAQAVQFALLLRVPAWCAGPTLTVNGQPLDVPTARSGYLVLNRQWLPNTSVALRLPMSIKLRTWTGNENSVSVDRGPLTYALKIGEKEVRYGDAPWQGCELLPTTAWNYGLVLAGKDPAAAFEVVTKPWDGTQQPFDADAAPLALKARARKIPNWKVDPQVGLVGNLQPSPVKSSEPVETITLIPMGCARLRIASFPTIGDSPDAHEWTATPGSDPR